MKKKSALRTPYKKEKRGKQGDRYDICLSRYVVISIALINGMGFSGVTAYVAAFLLGDEIYKSKATDQIKIDTTSSQIPLPR